VQSLYFTYVIPEFAFSRFATSSSSGSYTNKLKHLKAPLILPFKSNVSFEYRQQEMVLEMFYKSAIQICSYAIFTNL